MTTAPTVLAPDEGDKFWLVGSQMTLKVGPRHSRGALFDKHGMDLPTPK